MTVTIRKAEKREKYPQMLNDYLPEALTDEISSLDLECGDIEEIRLRRNASASLSTARGNIILKTVTPAQEIKSILAKMCDYSLYAHSDTINSGYITLSGGIRVGICGRAAVVCGRVHGVHDVSALNIRIPRLEKEVGNIICDHLRRQKGSTGVLIYSPPGVGKTTLLRSVAYKMASGRDPWRVSLIDTRGELAIFDGITDAAIDILSGYPKAQGIEIAARTMNAQLAVCDEIGANEAEAIIGAQNCGVPLLASAHGDSIVSVLRRKGIYALHRAGVFGVYAGIERIYGKREYRYTIHTAKEADAYT